MATFGEFFDRVANTRFEDALNFFEMWIGSATEDEWTSYRQQELTPELVRRFAVDVTNYFSSISRYLKEGAYRHLTLTYSTFIRGVHEHATDLGVVIPLRDVKGPAGYEAQMRWLTYERVPENFQE